MSENFIIVEKVEQRELESILMDLANLYADTGFSNGIQLYRKKNVYDSFLILFSNQPDFDRFTYFVNYIKYPISHQKFAPFLRGFYKTSEIHINSEIKTGEWMMVFVAENETDYDNVNLVNIENENYIYDFGGRLKKLNSKKEIFKLISYDLSNYHHIIDIFPSKTFEDKELNKSSYYQKIKDILAILTSLIFTIAGFYALDSSRVLALVTISFFGFGFIILVLKFIFPNSFDKSNK